jgi:macrolide transport system ATP-binding/permease protein
MWNELRYAIRSILRAPGFTGISVATLTFGIAVNTIVFTTLNSLTLRPIPAPDASRIVRMYPVDRDGRRRNLFSYPDYLDYRSQAQGFEVVAGYIPSELTVGRSSLDTSTVEPRTSVAYVVSPGYFDIVGLRPSLGRLWVDGDDREGALPVVISHGMWQRRFGGSPAALGATISLNAHFFTIIGVGPPEFHGTEPLVAEAWIPLAAQPFVVREAPSPGEARSLERRDFEWLLMIGRLQPAASRAATSGALSVVARRLAAVYPDERRPVSIAVVPGTFFTLEPDARPVIALVFGTVGLVLLIACANVMNLTLARATARQKEIAIRLAIGAGRWRIVRHLLIETMLVAMVAGGAALVLSVWTLRVLYLTGLSLSPFPWTIALTLEPDIRVFAYTFGLAACAGLLFGLAPAIQLSAPSVVGALHDEGRMLGLRLTRSRFRRGLVVLQIAACVVLLIGAGLLTRGLRIARALDLGFDPGGVVYAEYDLRRSAYTPEKAATFSDELRARALKIPGVSTAAFTSHVPLHGGVKRTSVHVVDSNLAGERLGAAFSLVSPDYFDALGVRIVQGRNFVATDPADRTAVVISEGLAKRFWPAASPVGKAIALESERPLVRTVVGVARDASNTGIFREKEMALYLPLRPEDDMRGVQIIMRSSGNAAALAGALRRQAAAIDGDVAFKATPLDDLLQFWMLPSRVAAVAAGVLGFVALAVASIGIYGVLAFAVSQRTREIGIRMALGADRRDVRRLVLGDGLRLILVGLAAGSAAALATTPFLGRMLFGVSAFDPVTFTTVPVLLTVVALTACYIPARRASTLEPLTALRVD